MKCHTRSLCLVLPCVLMAFFVTSCRDNKVSSYRAAKEAPSSSPAEFAGNDQPTGAEAGPGPSGPPVSAVQLQSLTWSAPASWQVKPPGEMRKGSYTIMGQNGESGDVSITAFPGAVGGELANVNRWRGQLGLPPIEATSLDGAVTRLSANGLTFTLLDCVSNETEPRRILGAMTPYAGAMWFFKLTGPARLVNEAKPAFLAYLSTVEASKDAAP